MSTEIRYASVHLTIDKTLVSAAELPEVLHELGLADQIQEAFWVIAYDSVQNIHTIVEVARGNYLSVDVPIPAVLTVPLLAGTDRFEIAHNHPSNDATPTLLDVDLTRKILAAANTCGLYLEDHIILAPDGTYYSFVENGRLTTGRKVSRGHQRAV